MKTYKNLTILFLVLFLISTAALVTVLTGNQFTRKPAETTPMYGRGFMYIKNQLGFSNAQEIKYDSLLAEYHRSVSPLREEISDIQVAMLTQFTDSFPDTIKLDQLASDACLIQNKIRQLTFHHLIAVRDISTPEQQTGLKSLYYEMLDESKNNRLHQNQGRGRNRFRHGQQQ